MKKIERKNLQAYLAIIREVNTFKKWMEDFAEKGNTASVDNFWTRGLGAIDGAATFAIYNNAYVEWFFNRLQKDFCNFHTKAFAKAMDIKYNK